MMEFGSPRGEMMRSEGDQERDLEIRERVEKLLKELRTEIAEAEEEAGILAFAEEEFAEEGLAPETRKEVHEARIYVLEKIRQLVITEYELLLSFETPQVLDGIIEEKRGAYYTKNKLDRNRVPEARVYDSSASHILSHPDVFMADEIGVTYGRVFTLPGTSRVARNENKRMIHLEPFLPRMPYTRQQLNEMKERGEALCLEEIGKLNADGSIDDDKKQWTMVPIDQLDDLRPSDNLIDS
jgi:hypothetical protein